MIEFEASWKIRFILLGSSAVAVVFILLNAYWIVLAGRPPEPVLLVNAAIAFTCISWLSYRSSFRVTVKDDMLTARALWRTRVVPVEEITTITILSFERGARIDTESFRIHVPLWNRPDGLRFAEFAKTVAARAPQHVTVNNPYS